MGLIFGPLLISYFLILVNIYQKEYLAPIIIDGQPDQPDQQIIIDAH
jgi:hypothetical protein